MLDIDLGDGFRGLKELIKPTKTEPVEIERALPTTSDFRYGAINAEINADTSKIFPALYEIGQDIPGSLRTCLQVRGVMKPEKWGHDRITYVVFAPDRFKALTEQGSFNLPHGYELDEANPVVFSNPTLDTQLGFFDRYLSDTPCPPELREQLRKTFLEDLRDLNFAQARLKMPEAARVIAKLEEEYMKKESNTYHQSRIIEEWLNGNEIYMNNAGSFMRGPESERIALALKKEGEEPLTIPTSKKATPLSQRLLNIIKGFNDATYHKL